MARRQELERLTVRELCSLLKVDELKALIAQAQGKAQGRKAEQMEQLDSIQEEAGKVRALYEGLDDLSRKVIQEATHDPEGVWHQAQFAAKYGQLPSLGSSGRWASRQRPTSLRLFFAREPVLATDLRTTLLTFVPKPPPLSVSHAGELPAFVRRPHVNLGGYHRKPDQEEVELRVRETTQAALLDVKAVLRLVDAGEVKVGEKTRRPSQASMKVIANVLSEGDFYEDSDCHESGHDPAADLAIKAFAWPMLIQAGGLVGKGSAKLQLSPTGRKATTKPAHEVIRQIWDKWVKTTLIDEFNRVDVIKGQQTRGSLTAVGLRRHAVIKTLKECPVGEWIHIEEFFRLVKVWAPSFLISFDPWKLYLVQQNYGSFGYEASYTWESLQGRYTLAFLFEYVATLGLLDVAYISPVFARNDFRGRWGTDDYTCLSRYDGLMYVRIDPLGAWCLGQADTYEPRSTPVARVLKVLPNLDVVAPDRAPPPPDVLFLERFAEPKSEAVWHLTKEKFLLAVEQGLPTDELREFLTSRSRDPLPQTVEVFLDDLEARAGQIEDLGAARLLECKDPVVAQTLASDRQLRGLCQLAGDRHLVFRTTDETAVRRALRGLGYILPPPR